MAAVKVEEAQEAVMAAWVWEERVVSVVNATELLAAVTEEETTVVGQGTEAGRRTVQRTGSCGLCLSPALQASMQSCLSP